MTHTTSLYGQRTYAHKLVDNAPSGSVMTIKPPRRSIPQNDKLHAMITDIMEAQPEGRNYPMDVWKPLFMAMAGHKVRFEPSLDGSGVVPIGFRTSGLTKAEFSDLIECVQAYAAMHGVKLRETA